MSHKLYGFEIFRFNYYGKSIYLCVGEVDDNGVYVYELKTVDCRGKYKGYERLSYNTKSRRFNGKKEKECLVIPNKGCRGNSFFSKSFYISPIMRKYTTYLPIRVSHYSPLFWEAVKLGIFNDLDIKPGVYLATKICDGSRKSMAKIRRTYFKKVETPKMEETFYEA